MSVREASVYWIETSEGEIHFIDAIVSAYDGLANVRREYRIKDGKTYFKVYVGPGLEGEFEELLAKLQEKAAIGDVFRDDEASAPM